MTHAHFLLADRYIDVVWNTRRMPTLAILNVASCNRTYVQKRWADELTDVINA